MEGTEFDGLKKRIGEQLVWHGIVTQEQVNKALEVQKERSSKLVATLINLGYLDEDTFLDFLARQSGVPSIDIANYEIRGEVLELIPPEFAREHEVFPLDRMGKLLTLAMVCPEDRATLDTLAEMIGLRIKPILCSAADVREAISTYYGGHEETEPEQTSSEQEASQHVVSKGSFKLARVTEIIKRIDSLPTLPAILERIRSAMTDPISSSDDMAKIINTDPAVASKLLRVANSAAYGFSRKIGDIKHAIALLGFRETYQIALSVHVMEMLATVRDFDYRLFRKHSSQCAAAANLLAQHAKAGSKVGIFSAGLLHDIGKLVFVAEMSGRYAHITARIEEESSDSSVIEEEEIGISHAEIGFMVADHWRFPVEMAEAIRFHHRPELSEEDPVFTTIIALADRITNDIAAGEDPAQVASKYPDLLATLELKKKSASKFVEEYADASDEVEIL